ncbi:MAG: metallophosphoesterase family protein [Planctomycetota bacterium]|jgi:predicted phosphodiesterase
MIAVLSDVHANLEALRAVVRDIGQRGIQRMFFLGDIIGYGPNPREVLDFLKNFEFCLMGNHDRAVLTGPPKNFNPVARRATKWTRTQIHLSGLSFKMFRRAEYERRVEYWNFLLNLKPFRKMGEMFFAHDNPTDPGNDKYVTKQHEADSAFARHPDVRAFFIGHSHVPMVWRRSGKEKPQFGKKYQFDGQTIVNVGSVGQPRDKIPRSCYVIVDDGFRFVRVDYDIERAVKKIRRSPLDSMLADRLQKGY